MREETLWWEEESAKRDKKLRAVFEAVVVDAESNGEKGELQAILDLILESGALRIKRWSDSYQELKGKYSGVRVKVTELEDKLVAAERKAREAGGRQEEVEWSAAGVDVNDHYLGVVSVKCADGRWRDKTVKEVEARQKCDKAFSDKKIAELEKELHAAKSKAKMVQARRQMSDTVIAAWLADMAAAGHICAVVRGEDLVDKPGAGREEGNNG